MGKKEVRDSATSTFDVREDDPFEDVLFSEKRIVDDQINVPSPLDSSEKIDLSDDSLERSLKMKDQY